MPAFLVDEDLPRSLATSLRERGYVSQIIGTLDMSLPGLLAVVADGTLRGFIIVIEPGQIRFRRFEPRS